MPVAIPRAPPVYDLSPHPQLPFSSNVPSRHVDLHLDLGTLPQEVKPDPMPTPPPMNPSEFSMPSSAASTQFSNYHFGSAPSWPIQGLYTHPHANHSQSSLWNGSANYSYASSVADGSDNDVAFSLPTGFAPDRRASCPAEFIANFNQLGMPTLSNVTPTVASTSSFASNSTHLQQLAAAYNMRRHSVAAPVPAVPRHLQTSPLSAPTNLPRLSSRRASCVAALDPIAEAYSPPALEHVPSLPNSFFSYELPASDDSTTTTIAPQIGRAHV